MTGLQGLQVARLVLLKRPDEDGEPESQVSHSFSPSHAAGFY